MIRRLTILEPDQFLLFSRMGAMPWVEPYQLVQALGCFLLLHLQLLAAFIRFKLRARDLLIR